MKKLVIAGMLIILSLLGVAECCKAAPSKSKESPKQAPKDAKPITVSEETRRIAAGQYLVAVQNRLLSHASMAPGFGNVGEKSKITSDDINGVSIYEYNSGGLNHVRVTVMSSGPGHKPVNDENNRYFTGLELQVNIYVSAETPELVGFISDIIRKCYWELEKYDPVYASAIIAASEKSVRDIYNAIAKLEPKYLALKGFKTDARMSINPENLTYGVFFAKDMGKSTMKDPAGELLTPDSCYIGFYVGEYIEFMNRYVTGDPAWHFNLLLPNRNIEISWTVSTHDSDLAHKLYEIVKEKMKPLTALDPDIRPAYSPAGFNQEM